MGKGVNALSKPVDAVFFDRDDTLIVDVPYNGDPSLVRPMPTAGLAVELLRSLRVPIGVISNQSGIARGLLTRADVDRVNTEVARLLGPFDDWQVCPHSHRDACGCRKPQPGMILRASRNLGVSAERVVMIGDIAADVAAAEAAGATGILVPTSRTRAEEVRAATYVARNLLAAVEMVAPLVREVAA